jgi:hypothetical protein
MDGSGSKKYRIVSIRASKKYGIFVYYVTLATVFKAYFITELSGYRDVALLRLGR